MRMERFLGWFWEEEERAERAAWLVKEEELQYLRYEEAGETWMMDVEHRLSSLKGSPVSIERTKRRRRRRE
jgi:hypothetical protein